MNTDRRLRIGYVTVDDAHDRRTWSGTNFYLKQALEARYDVVPLGPLEPQPELFMARALNQATLKIIKNGSITATRS